MIDGVSYLKADEDNFNVCSLDNFILNQNVSSCWRLIDGSYKLTPVAYTEDWNLSEKRALAAKIIYYVKTGSVAFIAVNNGQTVGFALLNKSLFGSKSQYADLAEFYVSKPYRRKGIGKKLFHLCCVQAEKFGAEKLYISAHSAEESISAYKKYGCKLAEEPDKAHSLKEPFDLQLEFRLGIYEISDKKKYTSLFLLADEQPEMVEKYINDSRTFVLDDNGIKGEITVKDIGGGILEIKNLAVYPEYQKQGCGKKLIDFISAKFSGEYEILQVGTGKSPLTLPFYKKCGFTVSHTVKNFFVDNYDHEITEAGVVLKDMIYLQKSLKLQTLTKHKRN